MKSTPETGGDFARLRAFAIHSSSSSPPRDDSPFLCRRVKISEKEYTVSRCYTFSRSLFYSSSSLKREYKTAFCSKEDEDVRKRRERGLFVVRPLFRVLKKLSERKVLLFFSERLFSSKTPLLLFGDTIRSIHVLLKVRENSIVFEIPIAPMASSLSASLTILNFMSPLVREVSPCVDAEAVEDNSSLNPILFTISTTVFLCLYSFKTSSTTSSKLPLCSSAYFQSKQHLISLQ